MSSRPSESTSQSTSQSSAHGEPLLIGDSISLWDEDRSAYLLSKGFPEDAVDIGILDGAIFPDNFPSECVFELLPQLNFTASIRFREQHELGGADSGEGRRMSVVSPAAREREREREAGEVDREEMRNKASFDLARGREVRYGMVLILRHTGSQKLVSVTDWAADLNPDGRRVKLDKFGSDTTYLRIMPRLRVHSEGASSYALCTVPNFH